MDTFVTIDVAYEHITKNQSRYVSQYWFGEHQVASITKENYWSKTFRLAFYNGQTKTLKHNYLLEVR